MRTCKNKRIDKYCNRFERKWFIGPGVQPKAAHLFELESL